LLRQQMISGLQYRSGFWARVVTNLFWGYVRAAILWVFYRWGSGQTDVTMAQAIGMVWLQQTAGNLLPGWGMDFSVWDKISSGEVGYELARPLDVYGHWYANAVAVKLAPFLMSALPVVFVAMLVPGDLGLMAPASLPHLLACLLALGTGLLLSCTAICLSYAMHMDVRVGAAPANFFMVFVQILAGGFLPLQLWPASVQRILFLQPFAGILDLPLRFFVGAASLSDLGGILILQLSWTLLLGFLGRRWILTNLRKLVLQGG
ncbi:MAG TPA: hypothetical protein PKE04_05735, partial [Clostridia bacterium]|nr:hypothetical protein [Clostridia bacterium]